MPAKDNAQLPFGGNAERQPPAGAPGSKGDRVPDFDDGVGVPKTPPPPKLPGTFGNVAD